MVSLRVEPLSAAQSVLTLAAGRRARVHHMVDTARRTLATRYSAMAARIRLRAN
jgi:hypothetical protein